MGRLSKTHSPITWAEFLQEALGELGIHPWELKRYTLQEYIYKRIGYTNNRKQRLKEEWMHIRYQTYFLLAPYLKKKDTLDKVVPDIYSPVKQKRRIDHEEIIKRYKEAGVLK